MYVPNRVSMLFALTLAAGCSSESSNSDSTAEDAQLIPPETAEAEAESQGDSSEVEPLGAEPESAAGASGSEPLLYDPEAQSWDLPSTGTDFSGPPLEAGDGPDSASECHDLSAAQGSDAAADAEQTCFFSEQDPETPAARIDQVVEVVDGEEWLHVRLTLNPNFVDNSFGETAIGWGGDVDAKGKQKNGGHTFEQLVGSDHAEMKILDANGEVALHFKLDYLSEDDGAPSGYSSLGVSGGEGKLLEGDAAWVLAATTSMDRNLNACDLAEYIEDSPTPASPDRATPEQADWDYRVVYEVWISMEAFGDVGFGDALIEFVHASPSKGEDNSVDVTPGDCPPVTDEPPLDRDDADPPVEEGAGGAPNTGEADAGTPSSEPVGVAR